MDGEGDLWDINVLLKMKKTDFKFIDLLLNRGHQFVTIAGLNIMTCKSLYLEHTRHVHVIPQLFHATSHPDKTVLHSTVR